jgi:hypothetical protein
MVTSGGKRARLSVQPRARLPPLVNGGGKNRF